ncbi:MLP-like protein 43 [Trifolium pratense]|uniref:MLP-like protein 43 n=1 Tax=Trifolium pratense TaxID=57577 RepID=UPI001E697599|nr:MLP-like protein 43 [Trifolium pratense]
MALSGKVESEVEIEAPAAKFYNVFRKQLEHLPNITTHIHDAKVHEGDWENVGSVKHWEFTIDGKKVSAKAKIESIDDENKVITYSIFDGEFSEKYKSLKSIIQVIDKEHGGGIVKWTYEYEKLKEDITGLSPELILDFAIKITKDIDAHLVKE